MLNLPYRFKFTSLVKLIKSATLQTYLPLLIIFKHKVIFNPNNLTFFVIPVYLTFLIPISHFLLILSKYITLCIISLSLLSQYLTFFIIPISHFLYYLNISLSLLSQYLTFCIIPISHFIHYPNISLFVLSQYLTFLNYPNISLSVLSQYLTFRIIPISHFIHYPNISLSVLSQYLTFCIIPKSHFIHYPNISLSLFSQHILLIPDSKDSYTGSITMNVLFTVTYNLDLTYLVIYFIMFVYNSDSM